MAELLTHLAALIGLGAVFLASYLGLLVTCLRAPGLGLGQRLIYCLPGPIAWFGWKAGKRALTLVWLTALIGYVLLRSQAAM